MTTVTKLRHTMEEADAEDILDKGEVPKLVKSVQEIESLVSILKCQICYDFMVSGI